MTYATDGSKDLYERALDVMVEGVSSPSRGPVNYGAYPIFIERGEGSKLYDVDGNAYIDWMMAYGALPLGHAHPRIVHAISTAAAEGTHFAAATEVEVEVAELIQEAVPGAERVRFANTGTEAAMAALRLARGYTGRPKFIKFEGHYHGWYDDFLVNSHPHPLVSLGHRNDPVKIADSSGLNRCALEDTIVVPWNDPHALEQALDAHPGQVAAVISEGIMANMGVIPPEPGYLKAMRELTEARDVLLILDETVTGFRIAPGGCAKHYGIQPDITVFGKALGAGLPVAAFTGRASIMEALAWGGVLHYGTQNASRLGLYAARTAIRELNDENGSGFQHTWELAERLVAALRSLFEERDTRAIVQAVGPMFQIMFTDQPKIRDYRAFCAHVDHAAYRRFAQALFRHGVYMTPSAALHSVVSTAHSEEDVAATVEAVGQALDDVEG